MKFLRSPRNPLLAGLTGMVLIASGPVFGFAVGDTIPGYANQIPSGSRADVRTTASYQEGIGWTVTFRRKLDTGDPGQDVIFAKGGTYAFQVATFDNGGGKEDPFHQVQNQTKVFTMTVPSAPGDLVFSEKPSRLSALSGRLLASDEIEITASWADPTRNDRRGEWTLGSNGSWVKNGENEDRIAFVWDMQNDGLASAGNCAATCHNDLHRTVTPGSKVDNWHWKASRSHPIGYSDDQWWYDGSAHGGNGRRDDGGVGTAIENVLENGHPKYMAVGGPGVSVQFLYLDAPQANGWARAVAYAATPSPTPTPAPTPTPSVNRPPVAHAGADRAVQLGALVSLDGRGSGDPDRAPAPLTYRWTQTAGPAVSLAEAESATPRFTPVLPGTYEFSLRVADGAAESEPDMVSVTVADVPVLVLGPNGGEQWKARTSQSIRWQVSEALANTAKPVSVFYSKNGGAKWVLLKKVPAKAGSWQWKPRPSQASTQARIRICAAASKPGVQPKCDLSDASFTVLK